MRLMVCSLSLVALLAAPMTASARPVSHRHAAPAPLSEPDLRADELNRAVLDKNAEIDARNAAARAAYAKVLADHAAADSTALAAQAAYKAKVDEAEADRAAYQAQIAQWQTQINACKVGDNARCRGEEVASR